MFSRVFVCPQRGTHVTISHDALDLTVQGSPRPPDSQTMGSQGPSLTLALALAPISDSWWPSLETCSNMFNSGPTLHQC